jgi:hypothetical protein
MLVIIEAELIYRPDGSFIKVPAAAYSARVRQLEAEGYDTSDAQSIADAEFLSLQNEDTAPAVFNPADAQSIADAEFLSLQNEDTAPAVFNPAEVQS